MLVNQRNQKSENQKKKRGVPEKKTLNPTFPDALSAQNFVIKPALLFLFVIQPQTCLFFVASRVRFG
jgi:hypothetical protein